MSEASKGKRPCFLLSTIEKTYGQPIDHWMKVLDGMKGKKHMEMVSALKSEHKLGHGHANALVAHHREQSGSS
jgi:hypothetical protein